MAYTHHALLQNFRFCVHQGGTSSGKTFGILLALFAWASTRDEPMVISIAGVTLSHLKRGALRDFERITGELGGLETWNKTAHTFQINRALVEFFSVDDEGKAHGGKRDILFLNEANLVPWRRARQLILRTAGTIILDFNPVRRFWAHEEILGRESVLAVKTTWRDNPAVSDRVRDEIEHLAQADEMLYRVYGLGEIGSFEGKIYTNVEKQDAPMPDPMSKVAYGLDFGFASDPCALVRFGLRSGQIYAQQMIYETGLTTADLHHRMLALQVPRSALIVADSAEPKSIEALRRAGWNVRPCTKGRDSVRAGISTLRQYRIISCASPDLDRELANYHWKPDRDGAYLDRPAPGDDHLVDALRYVATFQLRSNKFRIL